MSSIGILIIVLAAALLTTMGFMFYLYRHSDQLTARYTSDGEPLRGDDGRKGEGKQEDCFHGER